MGKRALTWVLLASFLVFSWSCYSWQKVPFESIKPEKRQQAQVSAVQTKSGEKIDLNKNPAANILADSIVGQQFVNGWVPFSKPLAEINSVWIRKLNVPVTFLVGVGISLIIGAVLYAITVDTTNDILTSILPPVS
jgi:hypothetical protein